MMLDTNKLDKLICPVDLCRRPIPEPELKHLLTPNYLVKYQTVKQNRLVSVTSGVHHCPKPDCTGLLKKGQLVCEVC